MAWLGQARQSGHGEAWTGVARKGSQGKARLGMAWRGEATFNTQTGADNETK